MKINTVYTEITNRCNLNCHTCYNRSGLNRETKEISPEELEAMYLRFRPLGMERILLSGGEPSLHSRFHEVLALADKYPELTVGIVTNGTNEDPYLIEMLNTRKNMTLQISLDGASEEVNSKTRGAGNFEKAVAFAKKIRTVGKKPLLKMVIARANIDDVEPFYRLALSLGFQPEYAFIYRSGNAEDAWNEKALSTKDKLHVLKLLDRLNGELGGDAFLPRCTVTCPYTVGLEHVSLSVETDGTIHPCQMMHDRRYAVGNLFETDNVALETALEQIVFIAKQRKETDYGCARCILRNACGRGCMGAASCLEGDALANDGECAYRKSLHLGYDLAKTLNGKVDLHQISTK